MKAFVIGLSKIESSYTSAMAVIDQLTEYGFDVNFFEGTYGYDATALYEKEARIPARYGIKTSNIGGKTVRLPWGDYEKTISRPGVIGCFYSHYNLWKKCVELDEPIFIFEDDVIFVRSYYPIEFDEVLMICTGKAAYQHHYYSKFYDNPVGPPRAVELRNCSMPGAVGYGITPKGAKKLVDAYQIEFMPADTAMNKFVVNLECHNYLMGRAAIEDDGKVSLTRSKEWNQQKQ